LNQRWGAQTNPSLEKFPGLERGFFFLFLKGKGGEGKKKVPSIDTSRPEEVFRCDSGEKCKPPLGKGKNFKLHSEG